MILLLLAAAGCSRGGESNPVDNSKQAAYYTFTDALDRTVVLEERPERVVSLLGSFAETWTLAGGEVLGVTDDVVKEEHLEMSDTISLVGTVKEPNVEEVLSLSPDFVLLSPDIDSHFKISAILEDAKIPHAFFKVEYFEDYLKMLDICTDITGNKDLYEEHGLKVQADIERTLAKIKNKVYDQPTVLFVRAFSSGAKAKKDDNLACKILADLETINIAQKYPSLLEELSIEEIISEDPDYIFVTTMGSTEKALEALKNGLEKNPAWRSLTAVKNDRYIILPKELFHYKPNAKWGESYRYLAEIIYPEVFH